MHLCAHPVHQRSGVVPLPPSTKRSRVGKSPFSIKTVTHLCCFETESLMDWRIHHLALTHTTTQSFSPGSRGLSSGSHPGTERALLASISPPYTPHSMSSGPSLMTIHSSRQDVLTPIKYRAGNNVCSLPMQPFHTSCAVQMVSEDSAVTMCMFNGYLWTSSQSRKWIKTSQMQITHVPWFLYPEDAASPHDTIQR